MRLDPAHFSQAIGNRAPRGPISLNRASPQALGLAAVWPLFAGPGLGLRDLSGKGAHLTRGAGVQTPAWTVRGGLDGYALDFDGGDEAHVAGGDVPSLDITGDKITLSCWIKPDTQGTSGGSRVISKRNDAGGSDVYALFTLDGVSPGNDGFWFRLISGGSTTSLIHNVLVTAGVWQHWCGTYDGATMRLYRNGVQVASTAKTGNIDASARAVHLGHREGETRYFDGAMTDVRVYNRALSAREVFALYDPGTRWGLYREDAVPRVWPKAAAGGAVTRTAIGSLEAALQRQLTLPAAAGAALQAGFLTPALADAALVRTESRDETLDSALQALGSVQADLDSALIRSLGLTAGLDANLGVLGTSSLGVTLDSAIRRLNLLSASMEAVLRARNLDTAAFDAWLALRVEAAAGLDAVALHRRLISGPALQGILRARLVHAAGLDAVIGIVATTAGSRTHKLSARGRHRVSAGQRSSVVPPGNRRH